MIAQIQMRRGTTAEWAAANQVVLAAGEMGLDTTIQKSKIGDGTTEWASLPWLNGDVTNPNLLHNWDFRNPVNQRGISGQVANGMAIDRWLFVGAWVESGHVHLNPGFGYYIEQRIETSIARLSGKTFTATLLCDLGYVKATGTWPATGSIYLNLTSNLLYRAELIANVNGWPTLRLHITDLPNKIYAAKLELGSISTLHLDPPMDYAVELLKCSRFLLALEPEFVIRATHVGGGYVVVVIPTKTRMRINPTHIAGEIAYAQYGSGTSFAGGSWSFVAKNQGVEAKYMVAGPPDGFLAARSLVLLSSEL